MKRLFVIIAVLAGFAASARAQRVDDVVFEDVRIKKNGDLMTVSMNINIEELDVRSRRSLHIVPVLRNGEDSLELAPVGIYGRGRYIYYLRNGESVFEELGEEVYKEKDAPDHISYSTNVSFAEWMDGSQVHISQKTCGCCEKLMDENSAALAEFKIPVFDPHMIFVQPDPEIEKIRELSGEAYIEFIVSRTDIRPEYRNNIVEINKILATIDSVKNDKDITVKKIHLKGFASPESPYSNNERLAKGRTEALKQYVLDQYDFDESTIITDYEPENWEGLRRFVESSNIPNRDAILAAIDSDRKPDNKEWYIKSTWRQDYKYLYQNCYPALRKTDYRIEYNIKTYTDINEIVEVFKTSPNKLSLNELFLASTAYEPGTEEYNDVFETAARMYPNDPITNLNAANVAIASGHFKDARKYLLKAGDSAEATYAWGLYYIGVGDYDRADDMLKQARELGISESNEMLRQSAALREYYANNY